MAIMTDISSLSGGSGCLLSSIDNSSESANGSLALMSFADSGYTMQLNIGLG